MMAPIPYKKFSSLCKDGQIVSLRVDSLGYVYGTLNGMSVGAKVCDLYTGRAT